ncbi:M56 family metallopeptidase [Streptomyces sp. NBC_01320]|uniref:M56 family metallopeptidase n=1 Tax=Streptomyces sp. NBC_01320 TaxID=2903824 RepID=UPI002E0F9A92|nr:M56 family metallopeptidase [Streptomyces sp. NBC_01320]
MGVFVYLPLVLPLTALPIVRLAEQHLHPRSATRLLAAVGTTLALCSTVCLALLMVVGTAQLPGNPLPDGWSDPEVRAAVPYEERAGVVAIGVLVAVFVACGATVHRHVRQRIRVTRALQSLPSQPSSVAVLPDPEPYAYALPGVPGRVVVSTAMMECLTARERRALVAHEQAHLTGRHHRYLLATQLAARANPFLLPLRTAVAYSTERWADEEAAQAIGDRRAVAGAVGKAALFAHRSPTVEPAFAAFAAVGPIPRRVAALLEPVPPTRLWPPSSAHVAFAGLVATVGTTVSALSSLNATVTLVRILHEATPL